MSLKVKSKSTTSTSTKKPSSTSSDKKKAQAKDSATISARKIEKQPVVVPSSKAKTMSATPSMPAKPGPSAAEEEEEINLEQFESSEEEDSSDEEGPDVPGVDIGSLPTVAKDDATVARKLAKAKKQTKGTGEDTGTIYLSRIPHGFYEDEMKSYFSQFGDVTRLRLARNKKTGNSKHYGFIEFASRPVAEIVAETMNNYLLMGHILQCKLLTIEEVHPELWIGSGQKWRVVKNDRVERQRFNQARTEDQQAKAERKLLKRQEEKKRKLVEMGIDYDMSGVEYKKAR